MIMILFPYYSLLAPSLHRSMSDFAKSLISFNPSYPSKNRLSSCFFTTKTPKNKMSKSQDPHDQILQQMAKPRQE